MLCLFGWFVFGRWGCCDKEGCCNSTGCCDCDADPDWHFQHPNSAPTSTNRSSAIAPFSPADSTSTSLAFASPRPINTSSPPSSFTDLRPMDGGGEGREGRSRSISIPPPPSYPPYPLPPPPPPRALSASPARLSTTPSRTPLQLAPLHQQAQRQNNSPTPTPLNNTLPNTQQNPRQSTRPTSSGNTPRTSGTGVTTRPPSGIISPRDREREKSSGRGSPHRWPKDPFNPAFYFEYWLAQNTAEKKALLSLQARPEEFKENFSYVLYNWISFGKAALGWWGRR